MDSAVSDVNRQPCSFSLARETREERLRVRYVHRKTFQGFVLPEHPIGLWFVGENEEFHEVVSHRRMRLSTV